MSEDAATKVAKQKLKVLELAEALGNVTEVYYFRSSSPFAAYPHRFPSPRGRSAWV